MKAEFSFHPLDPFEDGKTGANARCETTGVSTGKIE